MSLFKFVCDGHISGLKSDIVMVLIPQKLVKALFECIYIFFLTNKQMAV